MQKFTPIRIINYNAISVVSFGIIILSIYGCNPQMIPLKSKYVDIPIETTVTKSPDSIWLAITDLFAAKGLKIKSIDKKEGLITTKRTSFISAYSFEDSSGRLEQSQAWVVLPRVFQNKDQWIPKKIYSQWKIQVTEGKNETSLVRMDPIVICTYFPNTLTSVEARGQSTGTLEGLIAH